MNCHKILLPDWVVGFTDAEGHFSLIQNQKTIRCRFFISQDKRSAHVLHELKSFFNVVNVYKTGGTMVAYTVSSLRELQDVIIPFFERYTLQTVKYYDWLKFRNAVQAKAAKKITSKADCSAYLDLEDCKKEAIPNSALTPDWFIGFVDGEGCFTVSIVKKTLHVRPQLVIGLHGRDRVICERIQSFLNCGVVYLRKNGVVVFQVSKLKDLMKLFALFYIAGRFHTLRTHKRRRASLFWRIVHSMQEGKHRDSTGLALMLHWKEKMRFPKKSQVEEMVQSPA